MPVFRNVPHAQASTTQGPRPEKQDNDRGERQRPADTRASSNPSPEGGGISIKAQKRREMQAPACSLAEIDVTGGPVDTDLLIRGIIPIPNYTTLWHPIIIAEKPDEVSPNGFLLVIHQA